MLKYPGVSLASLTTSANGFCWLATTAAAAAAAAAATAGTLLPERAEPLGAAGSGLAAAGALFSGADVATAVAASAAAATVFESGAGKVAQADERAEATPDAISSFGRRFNSKGNMQNTLKDCKKRAFPGARTHNISYLFYSVL